MNTPQYRTWYYYCGDCDEAFHFESFDGFDANCPECGDDCIAFAMEAERDAAQVARQREAGIR